MINHKAFRTDLEPDKKQGATLARNSGAERFFYTSGLTRGIELHRAEHGPLNTQALGQNPPKLESSELERVSQYCRYTLQQSLGEGFPKNRKKLEHEPLYSHCILKSGKVPLTLREWVCDSHSNRHDREVRADSVLLKRYLTQTIPRSGVEARGEPPDRLKEKKLRIHASAEREVSVSSC